MSRYEDADLPLHRASREGDHITLELLLSSGKYGANDASHDFSRPLHEACFNGHFQCVQILLDYGAQVNVRNIDGATPLCDASAKGSVDIVQLLLKHGALVNLPLTLHSPLHEAAASNHWECLEVLLENGANPNVSDCFYGSPLHVAANKGHFRCAEALLRRGANVNTTYIHCSPLHLSAMHLDEQMVRLMLEHGANVYRENNQGDTPLSLASRHVERAEAVKELLYCWEKNPKSLSHYCRLSIRNIMGTRGLHHLQNLPITVPQFIKDFLQFCPQRCRMYQYQ